VHNEVNDTHMECAVKSESHLKGNSILVELFAPFGRRFYPM